MVIGVIPARLESTRFPRKILFPIFDRPMVVRAYEQAQKAKQLDKILIAIDSDETAKILAPFGADVIMTSPNHQSGTDRSAEAIADFEADIIINIQADEPMIDPQMLDDLVSAFDDKHVKMATLASTSITSEDLNNQNSVKVSIDKNYFAEGFYREIEDNTKKYFRHVGIYGYRRNTLEKFTQLPQSDNEIKHKLEQSRALDNGIPIKVVMCDYKYHGIDTVKDLKQLLIDPCEGLKSIHGLD